jgi:two-component system cell cycle response regulator
MDGRDHGRRTATEAFRAHRIAVLVDPVCRWAMAAGIGWVVAYRLMLTAVAGSDGVWVVSDVIYLIPITLAVWTAARAGRRRRAGGRSALVWRWIAVSNVFWLVGEIAWSLHGHGSSPPVGAALGALRPFDTDSGLGVVAEWVADIGYTLSYMALTPAAMLGFDRTRGLWRLRGLLDAALVALGAGAIGWHLLDDARGGPATAESGAALTQALALAYPVCGLLFVVALLSVALAGHKGLPCSLILAAAAISAGAVSDAGFARLTLLGGYTETSWENLGWQLQAVLLALGGFLANRHPDVDPPPARWDRDRAFWAVLASGLAIAVLIGLDQREDGRIGTGWLIVGALIMIGLLARQALITRDRTHLAHELRIAMQEQERLAVTDSLTGLYNRRFLQAQLGLEIRRAARDSAPVGLILVDLDRFTLVNESYGPAIGDAVLVQAADRLRTGARHGDVLARYGGEEFACLLPGANEETALEIAERLRQLLRATPIAVGAGGTVALTASLGVAALDRSRSNGRDLSGSNGRDDGLEQLLQDADNALTAAKERGRDRVVVAGRASRPDDDLDVPAELAWLADRVDRVLGGREHSTAVARWCLLVGGYLALDHVELRQVVAAGRLHDIGRFALDPAIIRSTGPLTETEWDAVRRHPEEGARLLFGVGGHAGMAALAPLVEAHHERWDGQGYPRGLAGDAIPLGARIIAVCDSWAAMRVDRPYAVALSVPEARAELMRGRGTQFDPIVANAFLAVLDQDLIDEPGPLP